MNQNEIWAEAIIESLVLQGIKQFYLAPGYRSTSLVLAIEKNPEVNSIVFFDERALGFRALGYTKAKGTPCAIITTSGSAVANLLPAIVEAQKSHIPLIILSADRPYEMLNCGQNQTIEQTKIFSSYTSYNLNLPAVEQNCNLDYLASTIAYAVYSSKKNLAPVHINCPFRKPFYEESNQKECALLLSERCLNKKTITYSLPDLVPKQSDLIFLKNFCENKDGLIILSELPLNTDLSPIYKLADKLGWPIFADPMSKLHFKEKGKNVIEHYELILKSQRDFSAEIALQFGNKFISQALLDHLEKKNTKLVHISPYSSCYDPIRKITYHIEADPSIVSTELAKLLDQKAENTLTNKLKSWDQEIKNEIAIYFNECENLTEASVLHQLARTLSSCSIFFANSMPIRNCLQYFHPKEKINIFTNRGASGIDGNLSTTIGIHDAINNNSEKTFGIIGDQATLHDLNSLASSKRPNLHFLIFNNYGGGIFSHLPISKKKQVYEKYFLAKHTFNFKHIAKQFDLDYVNITTKKELDILSSYNLPHFIEVTTDVETDKKCQKEILERISKQYAFQ